MKNLNARKVVAGVFAAVALYIVVLPIFWPMPTVSAVVPANADMHEVMKMDVALHAWHCNIDITRVRFYVDYTNTTAKGSEGIFYPLHLVDKEGKRFAGFMGRNPISWPHTQQLATEIDLGSFAQQGLLGPGELIGKLDITFNYVKSRPGKSFHRDPTRTATLSVPFRINIHE